MIPLIPEGKLSAELSRSIKIGGTDGEGDGAPGGGAWSCGAAAGALCERERAGIFYSHQPSSRLDLRRHAQQPLREPVSNPRAGCLQHRLVALQRLLSGDAGRRRPDPERHHLWHHQSHRSHPDHLEAIHRASPRRGLGRRPRRRRAQARLPGVRRRRGRQRHRREQRPDQSVHPAGGQGQAHGPGLHLLEGRQRRERQLLRRLPSVLGNVTAGLQLFSTTGYELRTEYKADFGNNYLAQEASVRFAVTF